VSAKIGLLRKGLSQQVHRRQRLERRDVPRARHHDIGLAILIVPRSAPDADAILDVTHRGADVEILESGLLAGDDHVHEIAAPQAPDGVRAVTIARTTRITEWGQSCHNRQNDARRLANDPNR